MEQPPQVYEGQLAVDGMGMPVQQVVDPAQMMAYEQQLQMQQEYAAAGEMNTGDHDGSYGGTDGNVRK